VPTYQYTCTECGEPVEALQKFTDAPLTVCTACGGRLRKVFSPVGIVFKGSGFYRTDSRNGATAPATKDKEKVSDSAAASSSSSGESSSGSGNGNGSSSGDKPAAKKAETASTPSKSSSGEKVA
jgi:putative FmdB family regulatory protein